jgi:hypothetical protein
LRADSSCILRGFDFYLLYPFNKKSWISTPKLIYSQAKQAKTIALSRIEGILKKSAKKSGGSVDTPINSCYIK